MNLETMPFNVFNALFNAGDAYVQELEARQTKESERIIGGGQRWP